MKTRICKLVLGVLITLLSFSVNAQNYQYIPLVKPGLQLWTCEHGNWENNYYSFRRYALTDEDTIIEDETYKKLYLFTDIEFNPLTANCVGGIRENAQKQVFFRGSLVEGMEFGEMLYDFSLSLGDTFTVNNIIFEVSAVDTIYYTNIPRKRLTIRMFDSTFPIAAIWIEGIGSSEGLLSYLRGYISDNWNNTRCFIHNGELLYSNYLNGAEDCITPLVGIENISLNDNSITLYPNPTNSEVNISSENIINSIEIFNSLGQRVYQSVVNSTEKVIDISTFVNGVYILGVKTDNGVIRKKIIKN
ncbi:MAG: T9SS type A sorting domain-containing protein [Bacteroidales bacterium]|nr:T9SS type A sorting domain-containing protein [Bacteroidales bacterium]